MISLIIYIHTYIERKMNNINEQIAFTMWIIHILRLLPSPSPRNEGRLRRRRGGEEGRGMGERGTECGGSADKR